MDILHGLKDHVSNFFTPKKRPKPSAPVKKTSKSLKAQLDDRSMSPNTKTARWLSRHSQSVTPHTRVPPVLNRRGGAIVKKTKSPAGTKSSAKNKEQDSRRWSFWTNTPKSPLKVVHTAQEDDIDLDGPTLVEAGIDNGEEVDFEGSTLLDAQQDEDKENPGSSSVNNKTKHSLTQEQKFYLEVEQERRSTALKRAAQYAWNDDEVVLYLKLSMRGFEPVLPLNWNMDFITIPRIIFTRYDERAYIKSLSGYDFRATKALETLIDVGIRIRDKLFMGLRAEQIAKKGIRDYMDWAEKDAGIAPRSYIPLIALYAGNPDDTQTLERVIKMKLRALGRRWRNALRVRPSVEAGRGNKEQNEKPQYIATPPTIYGFSLAHSIVAIASHDSADPEGRVSHIALFDFGKLGHDVWNGLAVAITVCHARNTLLDLLDHEELGMGQERLDGRIFDEEDPDV